MHAPATPQRISQTSSRQDPSQHTEWLALLQCASPRADLDRLASLVQHPFSWPVFLQGAEEHRAVPPVGATVKHLDHALIPPQIRDKLGELQRIQTLLALQLTAELFRLLAHFANAGIQVLITKGPALAVRCYGDPGMRQYGDLDLVVREADIRRATQAMLDLAYEPRIPLTAIDAKKTPGEYAFRKPGTDLLVEFHTERTFRYHPRPLQIKKLFERSAFVTIDGREVPVLSLEDELVLICVHGAKHFWERLMWIADVAALISRQPLDWDRALAVANEVGAQRMLHLGLRLAADLLDAELPPHLKAAVQADRTVAKLAAQIESRLAHPEFHGIGILQRTAFRVQMRGGLFPGLAYLLRLSLTPTEEDWSPEQEGNNSTLVDAISRPLRLAKKHSRRSTK
jgi:Uncharacterised nucleotidyltransferase